MPSPFNQLLLALSYFVLLYFSVGIAIVINFPSGYYCGWVDAIQLREIPNSLYWWGATIMLVLPLGSLIWLRSFLNRLRRKTQLAKTIKLRELKNVTLTNDVVGYVISVLPALAGIFEKNNFLIIMVATVLLSLIISITMYKNSNYITTFQLLGYNCYQGTNINGMPIALLSKRSWRSPKDILKVIDINENLAIII